jgi:hypothetical protein
LVPLAAVVRLDNEPLRQPIEYLRVQSVIYAEQGDQVLISDFRGYVAPDSVFVGHHGIERMIAVELSKLHLLLVGFGYLEVAGVAEALPKLATDLAPLCLQDQFFNYPLQHHMRLMPIHFAMIEASTGKPMAHAYDACSASD